MHPKTETRNNQILHFFPTKGPCANIWLFQILWIYHVHTNWLASKAISDQKQKCIYAQYSSNKTNRQHDMRGCFVKRHACKRYIHAKCPELGLRLPTYCRTTVRTRTFSQQGVIIADGACSGEYSPCPFSGCLTWMRHPNVDETSKRGWDIQLPSTIQAINHLGSSIPF